MKLSRRALLRCVPAGLIPGVTIDLPFIGTRTPAAESQLGTGWTVLVIDVEGRSGPRHTALMHGDNEHFGPPVTEVRHLFGPTYIPDCDWIGAGHWTTFAQTSVASLSDPRDESSPRTATIGAMLPSGDPDEPAALLHDAGNEALFRLCGWVPHSENLPVAMSDATTGSAGCSLLAAVILGDHPLDLAIGNAARTSGASAIFWAGEYRHVQDHYVTATIERREDATPPAVDPRRQVEVEKTVLDHLHGLSANLMAMKERACKTQIFQEFWV